MLSCFRLHDTRFRSRCGVLSLWKALIISTLIMVSPAPLLAGCGDGNKTLTIYAGRSSNLVEPLIGSFAEESGIDVKVKYAGSTAIASTIMEEGGDSPADVVFMSEPGSLGLLARRGFLAPLPGELLAKVDSRFRDDRGYWVGTSGRVRTVVYNVAAVDPETELPGSIEGFTDPEWKERIGWAPRNTPFQAFVTAFRIKRGDDAARAWLGGIQANIPKEYPSNTATVAAVASGEVDVGFVNHYYVERFLREEGPGFGARNHFMGGGDPGSLMLVAGAGILTTSENKKAAALFIEYLLSEQAQRHVAEKTHEYPLASGVPPSDGLPLLDALEPPELDLSALADFEATLYMLRQEGVLH